MRFLNSKERKLLKQQLQKQFGFSGELDGVFALHEKKEKVYLVSEEAALFPTEDLRVDALGLYVGAHQKGELRLSIEGTQLYGPSCTRNVVALTHGQMQRWLMGETLPLDDLDDPPERGAFVIVRCSDDYLGCGKATEKGLLNYVPKTRYVHATY